MCFNRQQRLGLNNYVQSCIVVSWFTINNLSANSQIWRNFALHHLLTNGSYTETLIVIGFKHHFISGRSAHWLIAAEEWAGRHCVGGWRADGWKSTDNSLMCTLSITKATMFSPQIISPALLEWTLLSCKELLELELFCRLITFRAKVACSVWNVVFRIKFDS